MILMKEITMKWNSISEVGNPKQDGEYFITVLDANNPQFPDLLIAYFYRGEWYDEYINEVIPNVICWLSKPETDEADNNENK